MQVAASSTSDTDRTEGIEREYVIGDNLWPLANILWRIYAEVSPYVLDKNPSHPF